MASRTPMGVVITLWKNFTTQTSMVKAQVTFMPNNASRNAEIRSYGSQNLRTKQSLISANILQKHSTGWQ